MLKRKISNKLAAWKNKPNHMCLLIQGARQVGKTYSVNKFANEHYSHFVELNFEKNPLFKTVFDDSLDVDVITAQISLILPRARFVPGKTLLFLDEIQSCPNARTALKFFTLDGRFDVIASGSLLGINYEEVSSFPVGHVERLDMHSLDFEEFLWAKGVTNTSISEVRKFYEEKKPVPEAMHQRMMELFREYIVIGGMPNAVQTFVDTNNYGQVLDVQRGIIADYEDDIAKYAKDSEKAKARACFLSIPKQLSRDYKKFSYGVVEKKAGARKYGGSLQWLYDAGIVNFCYNLEIPELPFEGNARTDAFKVYMRDTGLLVSMLEDGSQKDIIDGNLGIYKGAVYENIVADIFAKCGRKLYYYERNSKLEIDFFIRYRGAAAAVEVKSAANRKAKSMDSIMTNYGVRYGFKLSSGNIGYANSVWTLPLYMTMFLGNEPVG